MAVLGTPSVSLQERREQQWRWGARKGTAALRRVTHIPYSVKMAHPSAMGRRAAGHTLIPTRAKPGWSEDERVAALWSPWCNRAARGQGAE